MSEAFQLFLNVLAFMLAVATGVGGSMIIISAADVVTKWLSKF